MYFLILILPILSAIISGFFVRWLGNLGSTLVSASILFIMWLLSLYIFYEVIIYQSVISIKIYQWILIDIYSIHFGLLFDSLSSSMVFIVCTISGLVHLYSISYMYHDPYLSRFMGYLSFFTFFMLVLVTADNFVQLFIGWEGVGLCSYLLLIFDLLE
jgi:NADH:ubiquinone oxidoreductase subunit 5 (subunit L)/multisubunit Na+/H+ antiporter MnhA subunit